MPSAAHSSERPRLRLKAPSAARSHPSSRHHAWPQWRSWNCFLDLIDHDIILGQAKALYSGPLLKAGYGRVGIDGGWVCQNNPSRASACKCGGVGGSYHDKDGHPVVGLGRFPNLTALTAQTHALGVKLDFYGNSCNCASEEQAVWKSQGGNPEKDVLALSTYGMDGIKVDGCSPAHNISRWVAALEALDGPPLLLENCGDNHDKWSPPDLSAVSGTGSCGFQMYRISRDIAPQFYSTMYNLQGMRTYANTSRPGCWPYPDMLQVGSAKLSEDEARSHFAAWCITSSPLILGFDMSSAAASARATPIVSNSRAIAVNQAWHGHAGGVVSASEQTFLAATESGAAGGNGGNQSLPLWQVYYKPLGPGKAALLLLNISPDPRDISVSLEHLPIWISTEGERQAGRQAQAKPRRESSVALSDVWTGKAVAHSGGSTFTAKAVAGHASVFLIAETN